MLLSSVDLLHKVDRSTIIADRNYFTHLTFITLLITFTLLADYRLTEFIVNQLKLRQLIIRAQYGWFILAALFILLVFFVVFWFKCLIPLLLAKLLVFLSTENNFSLNVIGDLLFLLDAYENIFWVVKWAIPVGEIGLNFLDFPVMFI